MVLSQCGSAAVTVLCKSGQRVRPSRFQFRFTIPSEQARCRASSDNPDCRGRFSNRPLDPIAERHASRWRLLAHVAWLTLVVLARRVLSDDGVLATARKQRSQPALTAAHTRVFSACVCVYFSPYSHSCSCAYGGGVGAHTGVSIERVISQMRAWRQRDDSPS